MSEENLLSSVGLPALAKELLDKIDSGQEDESFRILDEITQIRESMLYQEIGKLTRELHNALSNFKVDTHISELAEKEIPDARERLRYVVSMTDKAANKTLNAVEESIPLCETLGDRVDEIGEGWSRFLKREMNADEFRALAKKISTYTGQSNTDIEQLKNNLNEVLLAQDFQDLTGQIIHRVINLVEDVENNLVSLIKVTGRKMEFSPLSKDDSEHKDITATGPSVPGLDKKESTVSGQDEVDDLLSSLGF
jgi:chemotaxis protein CheZ